MEKKGLCITCVYLKDCVFSKHSPVWQCEEFSDREPNSTRTGETQK